MKIEKQPTTATFETKDGRAVAFKAVRTVMVKNAKKPKRAKPCASCQNTQRIYQRLASDAILVHNREIAVLASRIVKLEEDLNDATWLLSIVAVRIESPFFEMILTPADKTRIAQWACERSARVNKKAP